MAKRKKEKIDPKTIPDFDNLNKTMSCYFKTDWSDIEDYVRTRFKDNGKMTILELRFFTSLMDATSNLFTEDFEQVVDFKGLIDIGDFNQAQQNTDIYLNCCGKSAAMIKFKPVKERDQLEVVALDATQYFNDEKSGTWFLKHDDETTIIYIPEKNVKDLSSYVRTSFNQKTTGAGLLFGAQVDDETEGVDMTSQGFEGSLSADVNLDEVEASKNDDKKGKIFIYAVDKPLDSVVKSFTYYNDQSKYVKQYGENIGEIEVMPFIERSKYRLEKALGNPLVDLEWSFISTLSWGWFNAEPKLLSQIIFMTEEGGEEFKKGVKGLGRTGKALKLTTESKAEVFDMGDIQVLKDALYVEGEILTQKALELGVSKSSVIAANSRNSQESGEHKRLEMEDLNKVRNKKRSEAKTFNRKLVEKMEEMTGQNFNYEGIIFRPLEVKADPMNILDFADAMRLGNYYTDAEAYSYVRDIPLSLAEQKIAEINKLAVKDNSKEL